LANGKPRTMRHRADPKACALEPIFSMAS
jgi:hypothetical protein